MELLYFRGLGDFVDWRDREINELKHGKKKEDALEQHENPGPGCAVVERNARAMGRKGLGVVSSSL